MIVPSETDQPLKIVTHDEGDERVLSLSGELDPHTAPVLSAELDDAIAAGTSTVVLELSGLGFVDSSGLRVIIAANTELGERGGRLVLRSPSETVRRLLEITGLLDHIQTD